jgi:hypothetical protein
VAVKITVDVKYTNEPVEDPIITFTATLESKHFKVYVTFLKKKKKKNPTTLSTFYNFI